MKLGFIGTGNMAGAIMGGIIKKGIIPAEEIIGSDICGIPGEKCPFSVHGTQVICQHLSNGNRPSWQLELISFKIHLIPSQVRDLIP